MPRCRHASDTFPSVSANSSTLMRCRASFSSAFIGFSPCAYYAPILSSEKPSSTHDGDERLHLGSGQVLLFPNEQVVGIEPPEAALRPGAVERDHRAVACRRDVVIALQKGPD